MALLLLLETSSSIGSVSLSLDSSVIATVELPEHNSHARALTTSISNLLHSCNYTLPDLDAIAYSAGPGSYTGLRIGLSTAKGLAYVLDKPLIAIPTLQTLWEAVQKQYINENTYILPMVDARREDAYVAVFNSAGTEVYPTQMVTVNDAFLDSISSYTNLIALGSATFKLKNFQWPRTFML
ncbi:MAG: tRNA (adenosine(37)-N6)-threonylcarbamoyltransferase complex dimerization subunit type 1 TsaB [Bacteroidetes bacterium]|nr:tRNA (adenosine(37)-N6)-threonylcarbamoyltransferase complex dimerization subunit type 1 TsaB [Bacteroidota bacterium]